jgi:glycosyltransferase involved in cell wall biosynthesis
MPPQDGAIRIAFVNSTHRWGGVKTWTLDVAPRLAMRGHAVHLFLRRDDPFQNACRNAGLRVEPMDFGPDWNPLAILRLRQLFHRHHIDIVVTNVSKDNRIGGPAARALGLPVLQIVGGPGDLTPRYRVRLEQRRYVTAAVVPARAVRDSLARFDWMDAEHRVAVLYNAVDLDFFKPGPGAGMLRKELKLDPSVPIVMTTGQLTSIKGHDLLLRAMTHLPGSPVLTLTSRGPEEEKLRSIARVLGIEHRVRFLGFRERWEIPLLLEDADVVVQPSLEEGLPISVLEFMAKGKAILATRISGIPEAIEDEHDGLLVPPGRVDVLCNGLERLLGDPALRARLGQAARVHAEAEFGLDTLVVNFEALLRGLLRGGRTSGLLYYTPPSPSWSGKRA